MERGGEVLLPKDRDPIWQWANASKYTDHVMIFLDSVDLARYPEIALSLNVLSLAPTQTQSWDALFQNNSKLINLLEHSHFIFECV